MEPILLIHGYSAESSGTSASEVASIYGTLPRALRRIYGDGNVFELDVSRYLSLNDGVNLDDVARAMNECLAEEFDHLLKRAFNVIIHSTGALVVRNWIRNFSKKPSPVKNVVYLAGANFGSGWGHIGKGQLAKWGRLVFQNGAERGVRILDALELGSNFTIDLHLHFLQPGQRMVDDYGVNEAVIIGSQADVAWYEAPIRYAKEDGSDGVVRVSGGNLNFNYVKFVATKTARDYPWRVAINELRKHIQRRGERDQNYEIDEFSKPGTKGRPELPLAIPYGCAHSGNKMGVVTGEGPRDQVLELIQQALGMTSRRRDAVVRSFQQVTDQTYQRVLTDQKRPWYLRWISEPRGQYDRHAQIIFRLFDQDGRPVEHYDIFFDSVQNKRDPSLPISTLFEDKHVNDVSPNIITFYLCLDAFDRDANDWVARVPKVNGCFLEVSATEPDTSEILYLPMRYEFSPKQLIDWVQPHRTTIIDVELLRLPSPEVFRIASY